MEVRSDRRHYFDATPDQVWDAIGRVDAYRSWWPWLRTFDAVALEEGETWRCTIRPPLPYDLRLAVTIDLLDHPNRIDATVGGDLTGSARVDLLPVDDGTGPGCEIRLRSVLSPHRGLLRSVADVAPGIARRGHDWVLDTGLRQFRRRAL